MKSYLSSSNDSFHPESAFSGDLEIHSGVHGQISYSNSLFVPSTVKVSFLPSGSHSLKSHTVIWVRVFCLRPPHCLISALYTSHKALEAVGGSFTFSVCTFYRSVDRARAASALRVSVNVPLHPHVLEFTGRDRNHVRV